MLEVIQLYQWTLLGAILGGMALALIGSQLAARNQAVQTLVVSQAASLGVVSGLALLASFSAALSFIPLLSGFVLAALVYIICEFLVSHRWVSRSTYYVGILAILMSALYTVIALVPSLESHMASAYFGDLATASDPESRAVAILGIVVLSFFATSWKEVTARSFETAIFGSSASAKRSHKEQIFVILSLITIAASVQFLGLLFTLSCLFLPILMRARFQRSIRGLPAQLLLSVSFGVLSGFLVSIWHGRIPTVPCIAAGIVVTTVMIAPISGALIGLLSSRK